MAKRQIKKTQTLMGAVMGSSRRGTRDFSRVLEALRAGRGDVVVEVPWVSGHYQQLILRRLEGDRVYFYNPFKGDLSKPFERRAEAEGESALLADLEAHFTRGKGEALLP
jgi:hypothetical protein